MPTHNLKLLILVSIYRRHYHNFYVIFFTAAYVCIQLSMNLVPGDGDSLWNGAELLWELTWPLSKKGNLRGHRTCSFSGFFLSVCSILWCLSSLCKYLCPASCDSYFLYAIFFQIFECVDYMIDLYFFKLVNHKIFGIYTCKPIYVYLYTFIYTYI